MSLIYDCTAAVPNPAPETGDVRITSSAALYSGRRLAVEVSFGLVIVRIRFQMVSGSRGMHTIHSAAKAGISRQTLSAVMNGRNCRPELLGKISRALGVEPEEIIE